MFVVTKHLAIRVIPVGDGVGTDCGPSWFREHLDAQAE